MKLSDAILKGCEISPKQARGRFFDRRRLSTCTLGAAYVGFRGSLDGIQFAMSKLRTVFPILNVDCYPFTDGKELAAWITYRNDGIRQTREQIAAQLKEQGL